MDVDDDEVRRQVAVALHRHDKVRALALKKQRDIRRAVALADAKARRREAASSAEMAIEDARSRTVHIFYQNELRAEADRRRYDEEQKLLQLVAVARKSAKSAGAVLSTPGCRGKERLDVLHARTAAIARDAELRRTTRCPGMHPEARRVRALLAAHSEIHALECMERAIHEQKWPEMLHLLSTTPTLSADVETSTGLTPLIAALCHRKPAVARQLIATHGATPNMETRDGKTALLAAVWGDDIDGLRMLVAEFHANVHAETRYHVTPLLLAIEKGRVKHVQLLLSLGADANDSNAEGISPLIHATLAQQYAVAEVLVAHGARWGDRGKDDRTALEWAQRCQFRAFHDKLQLLQYRPSIEAVAAVERRHRHADHALFHGQIGAVVAMVQRGELSPNYEGHAHATPLVAACAHGTLDHVQALLALGSFPTVATMEGRTPLMAACDRGHADMIICLVNVGASLASTDFAGADCFAHLREFPELVSQWTPYRRQCSAALVLGSPSRIASAHVVHPFRMRTELRPESAEIRVTTPHVAMPDDPDARDAANEHTWQLKQAAWRQRPSKRSAFEEERQKLLHIQQQPRRNGISVPLSYENNPPIPRPLCGNCMRVRATAYCAECDLAYCDRCVAERHIDADVRHHTTGTLTLDIIHRLRPPPAEPPPAAHPLGLSVAHSANALAAVRSLLMASCAPRVDLGPESDPEIKKRVVRERRDDERRRREARVSVNVPELAAEQAAAQGLSIFTKPAELRLARNYTQQKKFVKAHAVLSEALAVQRASFGDSHPLVGKTLLECARVHQAQENWTGCRDALLDALACFERHCTLDDKDRLRTTDLLFDSWDKLGLLDQRTAFARVLLIQRRNALGLDHALTLQAAIQLAAFGEQWERKLMFVEDAKGQRLVDVEMHGTEYIAAAEGRLPGQFERLLKGPDEPRRIFVSYCASTLHSVNLEFWIAVHTFKQAAATDGHQSYIAARDLFKEFLKTQRIKCTTATIRNDIRQCLRAEDKEAKPIAQIFDVVQDLVFQTLFTNVYLPFLQTIEGQAWHAVEHKNAIATMASLVSAGLLSLPRSS
ncbi:hypothetical protein ACHHYP_05241 [Achlya hypogyna]|uniref:B box-type domain-containing protein n=1 Tax=Achlya hypogyna TaxID=1202772 RepID=A0A1V9YYB4_ACHHY|nr:hypothetical protein ACHHYP_05241 [Achlya hypogyna]